MIGQKWTAEEEARLFELLDEGLSFSECGAILGRGKNSCISRAHRSGKYVASERKPVRRKREQPEAVVIAFPEPPAQPPSAPRYEQPEASTTAFGTPRPLLDLIATHCRWPVDGIGGQRMFCCAIRAGSGPYCTEHKLIAWKPARSSVKDLSRMARAYR